jgi:hypothetical protein
MILLSLIKELYSKIMPEGKKLSLESLEEIAEKVFTNKEKWEREIDNEISTLPEEQQEEAKKIIKDILLSVEK